MLRKFAISSPPHELEINNVKVFYLSAPVVGIFAQNSQLSEKPPSENSILHPEVFLAVMVAGDAIVKRA